MTFVNLSLLGGIALITLPIVLHLVMRRKPTLLEFPALRFIQKRHDTNQRSLNLRHLLLLLLRVAAIALLALALARPSFKFGGSLGSQEAPVAAALIFDASPHMGYRHNNQTRLEQAKEFGLWLMAQLPEQSEIAVLDTRLGTTAAFQADRGAAQDRLQRLEMVANSQPLPAVVDLATPLLQQSSLARKEIYIFTDLSQAAWPSEYAARLQQQLGGLGDVGVYVIDIGVEHPINCSLNELRLSSDVLSNRGTLTINADLAASGIGGDRTVELQLFDADRKPKEHLEQTCKNTAGESQSIEFQIKAMEPGVHQGQVRIVGQDGLAADDVRYFTVTVKLAWKILIAAPKPVQDYAMFLTEALSPSLSRKRGKPARFDCETCDLEELGKREFSDYAAVYVLDPKPMEPSLWRRLADYAAEGHGVGIFLGRNAEPIDSFNGQEAQSLLPGLLVRQARGDLVLAPRDFQHPTLRGFPNTVPWELFPVFRYWVLSELAGGVAVVIPYDNGLPALLEKPIGQGRSLTMTTPISDRSTKTPWNLLPIGESSWPFLMLANKMTTYLIGGGNQQLNYFAGQTAVVRLDASSQRRSYLLFMPDDMTLPIPAELNRRDLPFTSTDQVGNYRLQAGGSDGEDFGFSVNYAPEQTRLDRLNDAELKELFGPVKFRLARTREQIDRDISLGRVGRELYPPLIVLMAILLAVELVVSNRFYREK
jgi:hypothetical protein